MNTPAPASADPLTPGDIAALAEDVGVKKAAQDTATLFGLAVLGGAFVALGGLFASVTIAGAGEYLPYGLTRLLMGITFSLGLILVVIAGAQLFTSDTLMVMAWASGRLKTRRMMRVWTVVWLGNFVGALGTALLVFLAGHYNFGHGEVGGTAMYLASAKTLLPWHQAFFLGILCNVLVCLAVWLSMAAQTTTGKILAIQFPITAFVATGFEHCVANMFFVPYGLLVRWGAPEEFWATLGIDPSAAAQIPVGQFAVNLAAVTAGNWIGGAVLVGSIYWLIFRRNHAAAAPRRQD
jgi:formate transporter